MYSIDATPVIAMVGSTPAYREITFGTKGADVLQVQRFLKTVGQFQGPLDSRWKQSTGAAWSRWLRSRGYPASSTVPLGQVLFVSSLPRTMLASENLSVGRPVSGSDPVGSILLATPDLFISTTSDAAPSMKAGAIAKIRIGSSDVTAALSGQKTEGADGVVKIKFDAKQSCAAWCTSIPVGAESTWQGTLQLTSPVAGSVVPVGSLRTGNGDTPIVVLADGTVREIRVVLQVGADAVVEGVSPGDQILLPSADNQTPGTTKSP